MIRKFLTLLIIGSLLITISCKNNKDEEKAKAEAQKADEELLTKAKSFFKTLPIRAENTDNVVTEPKVQLGKRLYFDTKLSMKGTISCNSCHNLDTWGVDNKATSTGDDGQLGTRNSPTVFNAATHIAQFWDGRAKDVEEQAGMPVTNPVEMAMPSEKVVVERIKKDPAYAPLFALAFPEEKDPISYTTIKKAIAAFERTLMTPNKFDDYLNGNLAALTAEEKAGMKEFMDQGCTTCHIGDNLGGSMFMKFALFGNYWDYTKSPKQDKGKFEATKNEADMYIFKVPSLRNIEKTFPYFHDGSVNDLGESVKIMAKSELNKDLTAEQVTSIVVFLKALTGDLPAEVKKAPEGLTKL